MSVADRLNEEIARWSENQTLAESMGDYQAARFAEIKIEELQRELDSFYESQV